MIKKTLIYWRDIPSTVQIKKGRAKGKALLSARFQNAIDRAAMRARKQDSEAYMTEWRRVTLSCEVPSQEGEGYLQEIADTEAQKIESAYSDELLSKLAKNHGLVEA